MSEKFSSGTKKLQTNKQTNKDNLFDHFLPVEEEYEYKFSSEERFILGD